ncbi:hypothetical protein C6I21_06690 [Alkalicoccus urumqiensis]|uniref:DUF1836 domain-containing protein n=2 Tax=Alkalicoccus urumqiensis TaxID=1548213 RepID=A0A2P6MIH5_ALKUR|nr:hypothetical protein C6I21_06690 [Alkalicoccus urumqiensis]
MTLDAHIQPGQLPDLDLYMDQVIQLFEKTFAGLKREEKEKIMTKTMINNYAKGGLLLPVKNKRYTKEHVMLIGLIYEMKGSLALKDVKKTLEQARISQPESDTDLNVFYEQFLERAEQETEAVRQSIQNQAKVAEKAVEKAADPYVQQVLLILSLLHQSNLYRRAAENLIDDLPG